MARSEIDKSNPFGRDDGKNIEMEYGVDGRTIHFVEPLYGEEYGPDGGDSVAKFVGKPQGSGHSGDGTLN